MKDFKFNNMHMFWGLTPFFVYLISELILTKVGGVSHIFTITDVENINKANEVSKRIFMVSASLAFFVSAILITLYTCFDLWRRFTVKQLWPFCLGFLFVLLACLHVQFNILGVLVGDHAKPLTKYYELFGKSANDPEVTFFQFAMDRVNDNLFDDFKAIYEVGGFLLAFGIWAVISGSISCLALPAKKTSTYDHYKELGRLDHYLFLSSILLVSGIVYVVAWLSLPELVFPITNPADPQILAFKKIVTSMAIFTGLTFSIVIATYYMPIRHILMKRLPDDVLLARTKSIIPQSGQTAGKQDGTKSHKVLTGITNLISTTPAQKEFYSATLKIVSPIIVAWITTHMPQFITGMG